MNIKIIAVGKLKEKFLKDGIGEYLKRLKSYAKVEIVEVAEEKEPANISPNDEVIIKEREGERILEKVKPGSYLVVLAIDGNQLSSEDLAKQLNQLAIEGKSDMTVVIGGSLGLSTRVLTRADFRLSFSKMTFPHQLMRLILVEQIYRAFKIIKGEKYHK